MDAGFIRYVRDLAMPLILLFRAVYLYRRIGMGQSPTSLSLKDRNSLRGRIFTAILERLDGAPAVYASPKTIYRHGF